MSHNTRLDENLVTRDIITQPYGTVPYRTVPSIAINCKLTYGTFELQPPSSLFNSCYKILYDITVQYGTVICIDLYVKKKRREKKKY